METVETAKVSSKGQITIPLAVRKALKLREGDIVRFEVEGETAMVTLEAPEDPFGAWTGAWREGKGKSIEAIIEEERDMRGW